MRNGSLTFRIRNEEKLDAPLIGFMKTTKSTKVLVIDDCPDNILLLEMLLEMEGYQVCSAASGRAGLRSAKNEAPDLIILDLMMPDMSGLDVIARLDGDYRLSNIPTLLLTANAELNPHEAYSASEIFYKPFDIENIVDKIKSMLFFDEGRTSSTQSVQLFSPSL